MPTETESENSARPASGHTAVVAVQPHPTATVFPAIGDEFFGFQLVAVLGVGGFGKVFLARELALGSRAVALKVTIRPSAEPARLGKLSHPNVVPVHSARDCPPFQAICMPYLGRRTLADWLQSARRAGVYPVAQRPQPRAETVAPARTLIADLPPEFRPERQRPESAVAPANLPRAAVAILRGLAHGLAHAHGRGILHLDIKPANVLLPDSGGALLLDFNLAHDVTLGAPRAGGTIPYMAPEQIDAQHAGTGAFLDETTDLFALGVVAYELLGGVHPYPAARGKPDLAAEAAARRRPVSPLRSVNPGVPPALAAIVEKLLAADPAGRYASATALGEDLARHARGHALRHAANPRLRERVAYWGRRRLR